MNEIRSLPIALHRPTIALYMSGVRPSESMQPMSPPLLSSNCRASHRSLYAAACTAVLTKTTIHLNQTGCHISNKTYVAVPIFDYHDQPQ